MIKSLSLKVQRAFGFGKAYVIPITGTCWEAGIDPFVKKLAFFFGILIFTGLMRSPLMSMGVRGQAGQTWEQNVRLSTGGSPPGGVGHQ